MPGDVFRGMSGPASWAVSLGLGLAGALVGYVIFTLGLGIGDTDIFDWGGLLGGHHRRPHRARARRLFPAPPPAWSDDPHQATPGPGAAIHRVIPP
jgi:hypothetical protein